MATRLGDIRESRIPCELSTCSIWTESSADILLHPELTRVISCRGKFVTQLEEKEGVAFADIGKKISHSIVIASFPLWLTHSYREPDMSVINKARAAIPVTVQRRFDVYDDVAESAKV
jgi:hypothetical protein